MRLRNRNTIDSRAMEILLRIQDKHRHLKFVEGSQKLILETEKDIKILKYFLNAMLTANNNAWEIQSGVEKQIDVIEGERAV